MSFVKIFYWSINKFYVDGCGSHCWMLCFFTRCLEYAIKFACCFIFDLSGGNFYFFLIILIFGKVGQAFISGLLAALLIVPLNKIIASKIGKMSTKLMLYKDQRMRVCLFKEYFKFTNINKNILINFK